MTTQTTSTPDTGQMRFALDLIRWYSIHFPELPAPYVTVIAHSGSTELGLAAPSSDAFEMWREALEFDVENVELVHFDESSWLELQQKSRRFQVQVQLTCHKVPDVAPRTADAAAQVSA